jgi:hypothetical protein
MTLQMTSQNSKIAKHAPVFSNESVVIAGTIAVILLLGGLVYRESGLMEGRLAQVAEDTASAPAGEVRATDPPEPRLLYRSPDGVYSVEYGLQYAAVADEAGVRFYLAEDAADAGQAEGATGEDGEGQASGVGTADAVAPAEGVAAKDTEVGIVVRAVGGKERVFAALRAATEDSDVPEAHVTSTSVVKKLQNLDVKGFPAVEYMLEDVNARAAIGYTQVILIDAGEAGFFEIASVARTREQRFAQAEEHSRVLSSFSVLE